MATPLTKAALHKAFSGLDALLPKPIALVVGGGTAMMLAYDLPVRTTDVDAYPREGSFEEIQPLIRAVAKAQGLTSDWINPHYATFAHVLPLDYRARLRLIFQGARLVVDALGVEDLLIMKCFAGRAKDVGHARALLKRAPDLAIVERRIDELIERRILGAQAAADFLDGVTGGE